MVRLRAIRATVVVASTLSFGAAAYLVAGWHTRSQNLRFLHEINESALHYVELTVESADALLQTLGRAAPIDCNSATLQRVRLHVYEHSVIKDVRVAARDGAVRCSAYSETLEFDRDWPSRPAMLPALDGAVRLFRVQQFTQDALGVFRDVSDANALVSIVGVDPMQLDVLPSALRGHAQVALELANGETVAANASAPAISDTGITTVVRASSRYPIQTVIRAQTGVLDQWNALPVGAIVGSAGLLGALFGLLAARLIGRPVGAHQALDQAIDAGEFRPYYQPIFSLLDRRIVGCEVLMRWVLLDGRVLPPSAFIPLAESTGRIDAMTWQVVAIALAELRAALRDDPDFRMTFNAVPRHFLTPEFPPTLRRLVDEVGVSHKQIVVELTERDELEDHARALATIEDLRRTGFRFALDDVGVGHSGLSHIQSLRPNTLKIDKFFVDAVGLDTTANVVVDMLVRLAGELDMTVVAEGIETEAQLAALRACGVDRGQGYLVSPPVPLEEFLSIVAAPPQTSPMAA